MPDPFSALPPWSADLVAARLLVAFARRPGRPVLSSARGFTIDGREVEPVGWPECFVDELRDRKVLMTWVSDREAHADPRESAAAHRMLGQRRAQNFRGGAGGRRRTKATFKFGATTRPIALTALLNRFSSPATAKCRQLAPP